MKKSRGRAGLVLAMLLSAFLTFGFAANANAAIDYSGKLAELRLLLDECKTLNIPTDYEMVNYTTIERFEGYVNEDIANGKSFAAFNVSCLEALYTEAKTNLQAYIAGEKTPFKVTRADTGSLFNIGSALYDKNGYAFTIGYGHFIQAQKDVENFQNFGANNIQMEIGPTKLVESEYGWRKAISGTIDATVQITDSMANSGSYSLKLTNTTPKATNVFIRMVQNITCKSSTQYSFGCYSRGNTVNNLWMSANGFDDRNTISASSSWKKNSFTYTSAANQTELVVQFLCEGITTVYLDDFFLYELDSNGEAVSDNLLANPGFESNDKYIGSVNYVLNTLKNAKRNNIAVSLLLSPHYFPTDLSEDIYTTKGGFIKFNIDAPEAREVIENYLRALLPHLKDYTSLQNICISNEPVYNTTYFYNFYNPRFQEYLESVHGNISALNAAYGKSYTGFSQINMPTDLKQHDALCYDWIEFNEKVFTDWHKWMADIVREYLPNIPLHSKLMGYFSVTSEANARDYLARGTDLELFDEFSDYAGNDSHDYIERTDSYFSTMFLYDYQHSVTKKPVYNSEDHIISDKNKVFNLEQRNHLRNNLWMGAVHGRNMSSIWVWERSEDSGSDFSNSVLFRPDVVAEVGKTNLDLARLSYQVSQVQQEEPNAAIFYSKPTRLYDAAYSQKMFWAYKTMLNFGSKVGVVSDKSITQLSDYKLLIIPNVTHCKKETLSQITEFIKGGGKVIYSGNVLSKDEYNNSLDNSYVIANGYSYTSSDYDRVLDSLTECLRALSGARVSLIDQATGTAPINLDWQYSVFDGILLVNLANLEFDSVKNLSVYFDGEKLTGMKECISGKTGIDTVELTGYIPQLLQYKIPHYVEAEIRDISVGENRRLSWSYIGDYMGANIYSVESSGNITLIDSIETTEFFCLDSGTYLIRALGRKEYESKGKIVTVAEDMPLSLTLDSVTLNKGYVTCDVSLKNKRDTYVSVVVCVRVLTENGKVNQYTYNQVTLRGSQKDSIKILMPFSEDAAEVLISAWDSAVSKNLLADEIGKTIDR